VTTSCAADAQTYRLRVTLVSGTPPFTVSAGTPGTFDPANERLFRTDPLPAGTAFSTVFTDANGCSVMLDEDPEFCTRDECMARSAGTFNGPIDLCTPYVSDLNYNEDGNLDGGIQQFVIASNADGSQELGRVNTLPVDLSLFGQLGDVLYVFSIVGNDDGSGRVDDASECLSRSEIIQVTLTGEQPIVLRPALCQGDSLVVAGEVFNAERPTGQATLPGTGGACDTAVTVAITFIPGGDTVRTFQTLCPSESVMVGDRTFDIDNPSDTFQLGTETCFTTYFVAFTFRAGGREIINKTLCVGEQESVVGEIFNAARPRGRVQTVGANGCDSIIDVNLTFIPRVEVSLTGDEQLCNPEEITVNLNVNGNRSVTATPFVNSNPEDEVNLVPGDNLITFPTPNEFSLVFRQFEVEGVGCNAPNVATLAYNPRISRLEATIQEPEGGYATCGNNTIDFISVQTGDGAAPYQYRWNTGEENNAISDVEAGEYTVAVLDAFGCESEAQVSVALIDTVDYVSSVIDPQCANGTGSISISLDEVPPNAEYRFDLPGLLPLTQADFTFDNLQAGTYVFQIKQGSGCNQSQLFTISEPPTFNLIKDDTLSIALGDSVEIVATIEDGSTNFEWTPPSGLACPTCPTTMASPSQNTLYEARVGSPEGCQLVDRLFIEVRPVTELFFPTAFSPNGDDINDVLRPFGGPSVARVNSFLVFDRWGEMVFQVYNFDPDDETIGWNGNRNDDEMMPGVYVVLAEAEFLDGTVRTFTSDVTLLR